MSLRADHFTIFDTSRHRTRHVPDEDRVRRWFAGEVVLLNAEKGGRSWYARMGCGEGGLAPFGRGGVE